MYFLNANLEKQRSILLEITPEINNLLDLIILIEKGRTGGEKAKAARAARLAAINAETAAMKGDDDAKAAAAALKVEAVEAMEAAQEEATEQGFEIIRESMKMLLNTHYDSIIKIIAALYGTTSENLEEEKGLLDLADMIFETLADERLMRFFPQLVRLKRETQYDI